MPMSGAKRDAAERSSKGVTRRRGGAADGECDDDGATGASAERVRDDNGATGAPAAALRAMRREMEDMRSELIGLYRRHEQNDGLAARTLQPVYMPDRSCCGRVGRVVQTCFYFVLGALCVLIIYMILGNGAGMVANTAARAAANRAAAASRAASIVRNVADASMDVM